MTKLTLLITLLTFGLLQAQPPQIELTPNGLSPVTVTIPSITPEQFAELSKAWVTELTRSGLKFDISNVSGSSLTISGMKKNAFIYRDRGETHHHKAKLVMKVDFTDTSYTLAMTMPEIYADNDQILKYTLPDYFNAGGTIKEGYDDLEKSVEATANDIALNYYNFIINFK